MANMFDKFAADRKAEQAQIEEYTVAQPAERPSEKTTMTLSLTVDDKVKLKSVAAKQGRTVASLVHEWVATLSD